MLRALNRKSVKSLNRVNDSTHSTVQRSVFFDLVDAALHVKVSFGHVVVFAVENFLETADRVGHRNLFAGTAGEHFRHAEGLAQETLNLAGPEDSQLVLGREFVHAQDGDDVLEVLIALEHALNAAGDVIVFVADDVRSERPRIGRERVYGRVDAQFGDGALQHDGRVQVREGGGGSGVGEIVGGHVNGLETRDRAFGGRGDALLQIAHLGGEGRLVADGAGRAAEQSGDFRTGLREAETVVDEQ